MQQPTLADLRGDVQHLLQDWGHKLDPEEINREINRALDKWTSVAELEDQVALVDVTASTNPQSMSAAPGFQIVRVLEVKFHNNSQDQLIVPLYTAAEMDQLYVDWRDSANASSTPLAAVLDFNASTPGGLRFPRSIWLYPWPNTTITGGLVIDHVAVTRNYFQSDTDVLPVPAAEAAEWIVERVCAKLYGRDRDYQAAAYHQANATREGRRAASRVAANRTVETSVPVEFI